MRTAAFRVNLHCHSAFSDGDLTPEQVVALLASRGVVYASLTDHDSVEGSNRFKEAAARRGLGCVSGLELTAFAGDLEVHLLAYGADSDNPELRLLLGAARRRNDPGLKSILSGTVLRRRNLPTSAEAVSAVHAAGGIAVLAHPLTTLPDLGKLKELTRNLREEGLDGIEALYGPYAESERASLLELADEGGLLVTAGSDLHGPERNGESEPFVDMPSERWRIFRDALMGGKEPFGGPPVEARPIPRAKVHGPAIHSSTRIVLPTVSAIILFVLSIFMVIIPGFERVLMDRKKDTIRDLTTSIHSMLLQYEADVRKGLVTGEEARRSAVEHLRGLRYGAGGKDYFWVTDKTPVMIVHPYRPDLEGKDVGEYRDAAGNRVFQEFLDAVAGTEEGYVEYLWQWQDDAARIAPKLSFVKRFDPWGWVLGTGIYLDDVRAEIKKLEGNLRRLSVLVTAAVMVLILFVARRGLLAESLRRAAETSLRESYERYKTLSEARTEGLIMTVDGFCTFANETARNLLGYAADEITLLRISDILGPNRVEGRALERFLETLLSGGDYESVLKKKGGGQARVMLAASPFDLGGRRGAILSLRPFAARKDAAPGEVPTGSGSVSSDDTFSRELDHSLAEGLRGVPLFLAGIAADSAHAAPRCPLDARVSEAAAAMGRGADCVIVTGPAGEAVGLVTPEDLLGRCPPEKWSETRVYEIMRAPLARLPADASTNEALALLRDSGDPRIVLRGAPGGQGRIISAADLLEGLKDAAWVLREDIRGAGSLAELKALRSRFRRAAAAGLAGGQNAPAVLRGLSDLSDLVTGAVIDLTVRENGPPPGRFVFLALGSEGRREQVPGADQDNALVYIPSADAERGSADAYFRRLGEDICFRLEALGIPRCPGGVMASDPAWCGGLDTWKKRLRDWIAEPHPEQVLGISIFLDFRPQGGDPDIAENLRASVGAFAAEQPELFPFLARGVASMALPSLPKTGVLRDFIGDGGQGVDIKALMAPIAGYARIQSVRSGLGCTNTVSRLSELEKLSVIKRIDFVEMKAAYEFLLGLRLERGLAEPRESGRLSVSELGGADEVRLRHAAARSSLAQKALGFEFLGSTI